MGRFIGLEMNRYMSWSIYDVLLSYTVGYPGSRGSLLSHFVLLHAIISMYYLDSKSISVIIVSPPDITPKN